MKRIEGIDSMKKSIRILKFNCFFTSFLMLLYSAFECLTINKLSYNKFFIYTIMCYLLLNLFIFSIILLIYKKRNNKNDTTVFKKGITIGKIDIFNFISLFFYLFVNVDLLNHLASSPVHSKLGLLNFFLVFALINIADELDKLQKCTAK